MLSMFRMLVHPSSGAFDLFVESFHGLYCSGSMCVGGSAGVVWYPYAGWSTSASTNVEMTQQISRKFLRMDVLTFEICWALNNEIIKQVTSSWSVFIQLVWILFAELSERNFFRRIGYFYWVVWTYIFSTCWNSFFPRPAGWINTKIVMFS